LYFPFFVKSVHNNKDYSYKLLNYADLKLPLNFTGIKFKNL